MQSYKTEYENLNAAQREAVDTIEGPLLVIAGPGTGKTHLLSARIANVLRQPGVLPRNILGLTFTDNAARNMRERLESMIGQPAYHVAIHTFHSFGRDIINQYPDCFTQRPLEQPIDELGAYELLRTIFETLPHRNPLSTKVGEDFIFLKDTLSLIGWFKQNGLAPHELKQILKTNGRFFHHATPLIKDVFATTPTPKKLTQYRQLADGLTALADNSQPRYGFADYAAEASHTLLSALEATEANSRYAPAITAWRNNWLEKHADGSYVFKDSGRSLDKMNATAHIYEQYQTRLAAQGLYDFDDMVMEVVHALEREEELRLNLQEQYQYVLIDEFQDTNKAQLRIIEALGDNPVNENRPNIMVVGDPNQAIYAFQGAESSNVVQFIRAYRDVKVVSLTENYRSTQSILDSALSVLHQYHSGTTDFVMDMELAARSTHSTDLIEHSVFGSELQQYQGIAKTIQTYLKEGVRPADIAIIAPRHKYLERLMPYLATAQVPVAYERRENILEAPLVLQLLRMIELVNALMTNRQDEVDELFGEILSYPFWQLPTDLLVEVSLAAYEQNLHWLPLLVKHKNSQLKAIAEWFVNTSRLASTQPLEYILDRLSGTEQLAVDSPNTDEMPIELADEDNFSSPYIGYYFSTTRLESDPSAYLAHLGQLSTLRQHLRLWKPDVTLYAADLAEFVRLHHSSGLKIVDTNPHTQSTNAVQVMTAYKAKGLEFDIVFVINAQDEIWGPSARDRSDKIRVPMNLPVKPSGSNDSDKLRLLFVALTRAKHTLHLTSYTHTLDNKRSLGLSFIGGNSENQAETVHPAFTPHSVEQPITAQAVQILSTDWAYRYRQIIADKPTLFEPILANYKLSVTHLNNFLDVANGGPQYFLRHNLLHFPEAMSPPAAYGDAVHKTLQWLYARLKAENKLPTRKAILDYFTDTLARKHLPMTEFTSHNERGREALSRYLKERSGELSPNHVIERGFASEGVIVADARLSGKIDKLIPQDDDTFQVVDFKTGKPSLSWRGRDDYERHKLHRYRQQLMFYKLLVEHSAAFSGRRVVSRGALEFVEADETGNLTPLLDLDYDTDELEKFIQLIGSVWQHIQGLNFPTTDHYPANFKGTEAFETDLLENRI